MQQSNFILIKNYLNFELFVYYSITGCALDFRTCREIIWEPGTNRSFSVAQVTQTPRFRSSRVCSNPHRNWHAHRPNRSQTKPTRIKAKGGNSSISCTSIPLPLIFHIHAPVFFFSKTQHTWNLGLLWKTLKRFMKIIFKPSTDFILYLPVSTRRLCFLLLYPATTPSVKMCLLFYEQYFLFGTIASWILCQKIRTFYLYNVHEHEPG
jgi:hypothetical protein